LINKLLPVEMLEVIFHLLAPRDLKAVVLVCRWWREVGEAPKLWVWVHLWADYDDIGYMPEMLDSRRLQAVRRIVVEHDGSDWNEEEGEDPTGEGVKRIEELLQVVARHPGLKELDLEELFDHSNYPSSIDPLVLAQAVIAMEEVNLTLRLRDEYGSDLTPQVTAIFTAIAGNSKLKKLSLGYVNLSLVDAGILTQAVLRVKPSWSMFT